MRNDPKIQFLQIFAILLVCIGHSFTAAEWVYGHNWIYGFHMPLFIFISGYLLVYSSHSKYIALSDIPMWGKHGYVFKKAKRLLLPYFILSSLTFLPKILLSRYALRPLDISFSSYIHMLLYPIDNVIKFFWFLPTLFIISVLVMTISKIRFLRSSQGLQGFILCTLLGISFLRLGKNIEFLAINTVIYHLVFFVLGMYFCHYQKTIISFLKLSHPLCRGSLVIFYSFLVSLKIHELDVLVALTGILFSFSLAYLYTQKNIHLLDPFYGSSYTIYLLSWYPCIVIQYTMQLYPIPWGIGATISTVCQFLLPFFVYKWITHIKDRHKYGKIIGVIIGT